MGKVPGFGRQVGPRPSLVFFTEMKIHSGEVVCLAFSATAALKGRYLVSSHPDIGS